MGNLEKDVVVKVKKWCDKNKVLFIKFTPFGSRGWPDNVVIFPGGLHLWVELKKKGKRPRPLQYHRLEQLEEIGALAMWFDSAENCIDYLKDCLDAATEIENEVEPTPLSNKGNRDLSEAVRRGSVTRPRNGKDSGSSGSL